jgi:hypothetical protein
MLGGQGYWNRDRGCWKHVNSAEQALLTEEKRKRGRVAWGLRPPPPSRDFTKAGSAIFSQSQFNTV